MQWNHLLIVAVQKICFQANIIWSPLIFKQNCNSFKPSYKSFNDLCISNTNSNLITTAIVFNVLVQSCITYAGSLLSILCTMQSMWKMSLFHECFCYIICDSTLIFERNFHCAIAFKLPLTVAFDLPCRIVEN